MALIIPADKIILPGFVQGQMSLDIVLEQSITRQQSFARINREIAVLLGKCKREVRVRLGVKIKVKVSAKVS